MFPQEGECVPRIRFDGFTESWNKYTLGELVNISSGFTGNAELNEGIYKITRIETISYGIVDENKIGFSDKEPEKKYLLNTGDILYSNINSLSHIGKTAIYEAEFDLYHGINLLRLVPNKNVDSMFIFYYLNTENKRNWAITHANQAISQASINQTELSKQKFIIPNIEEQIIIGIFFHILDKQISIQQQKLDKLKQIKTAYLQKMFI
nr:restriction endonuclease subunit S [Methanimicrococcus sp. Hf6]